MPNGRQYATAHAKPSYRGTVTNRPLQARSAPYVGAGRVQNMHETSICHKLFAVSFALVWYKLLMKVHFFEKIFIVVFFFLNITFN